MDCVIKTNEGIECYQKVHKSIHKDHQPEGASMDMYSVEDLMDNLFRKTANTFRNLPLMGIHTADDFNTLFHEVHEELCAENDSHFPETVKNLCLMMHIGDMYSDEAGTLSFYKEMISEAMSEWNLNADSTTAFNLVMQQVSNCHELAMSKMPLNDQIVALRKITDEVRKFSSTLMSGLLDCEPMLMKYAKWSTAQCLFFCIRYSMELNVGEYAEDHIVNMRSCAKALSSEVKDDRFRIIELVNSLNALNLSSVSYMDCCEICELLFDLDMKLMRLNVSGGILAVIVLGIIEKISKAFGFTMLTADCVLGAVKEVKSTYPSRACSTVQRMVKDKLLNRLDCLSQVNFEHSLRCCTMTAFHSVQVLLIAIRTYMKWFQRELKSPTNDAINSVYQKFEPRPLKSYAYPSGTHLCLNVTDKLPKDIGPSYLVFQCSKEVVMQGPCEYGDSVLAQNRFFDSRWSRSSGFNVIPKCQMLDGMYNTEPDEPCRVFKPVPDDMEVRQSEIAAAHYLQVTDKSKVAYLAEIEKKRRILKGQKEAQIGTESRVESESEDSDHEPLSVKC